MKSKITNLLEEKGVKYCFNEQEYDDEKLKFIIVGDNPGNREYIEKRFFIGPSGIELRKHFKENNLCSDFDAECKIFNKCYIHTTKTKDLENIIPIIGKELFNDIQIECANEIAYLSNKYKLPILIFGKSNIGKNLLFDAFWLALNKSIINKENILVFNHPAPPYFKFKEEWDGYKIRFEKESNLSLLKKIGSINTQIINNKYQISNTMNPRFFYGEACYSTWPKLFVLTQDGRFYCEYLNYMMPAKIDLKFDYKTFKADDYKWDNFQTIVEIDEAKAKSIQLTRQTNWINRYLDNL
jgi:hypothetical protein